MAIYNFGSEYPEEMYNHIIDFETQMAREKNTACLTVRDAEEYAKGKE